MFPGIALQYADQLVLAHLAALAANGEPVTRRYSDIASATGVTLRTVQRAIPRLREAGHITCWRAGRGYPHTYEVHHEHGEQRSA